MTTTTQTRHVQITISTPFAPLTTGALGNGRRRLHPKEVEITAYANGWLHVSIKGPLLKRDGTLSRYAFLSWTPSGPGGQRDDLPDWLEPIVAQWRPLLLAALSGVASS